MTRPRCIGTRKDGKPCRAYAMPDGVGYCLTHDPNINERRCPIPVYERAQGYGSPVIPCSFQALHTSPFCLKHTREAMARNPDAAARFKAGEELIPGWR
jgi:hypothetical protein